MTALFTTFGVRMNPPTYDEALHHLANTLRMAATRIEQRGKPQRRWGTNQPDHVSPALAVLKEVSQLTSDPALATLIRTAVAADYPTATPGALLDKAMKAMADVANSECPTLTESQMGSFAEAVLRAVGLIRRAED